MLKETWTQLLFLFEDKEYNVTEALNVFLKQHPELMGKRRSLAAHLSWRRRFEGKIVTPHLKLEPGFHNKVLRMTVEKLKTLDCKPIVLGNIGHRIPDLIAIKNNKVYQVEIQTSVYYRADRNHALSIYAKEVKDPQYDGLIVITSIAEVNNLKEVFM